VLKTSGPTLIVDGAHNPYSMERLVETVNDHMDNCKVIVVFGAIGGHDIVNMLKPLKSLDPVLIPVCSRHPKAIGSEIVRTASSNCDIVTTKPYGSVFEGLDHAFSLAGQNDLILGTGSLSVAAEVSEVIKEIPPEIYPNLP
jgi:folylpolyglutamate synthase/dihydropteroate synthase